MTPAIISTAAPSLRERDRQRLDALLELFGPYAATADAPPVHWIGGGDAGPDWCYPCGRAVARHCRRTREYPEAFVDGGWDQRRESDGAAFCNGCGRLLGYALTDYGLAEEIAYWLDADDREPLTPEQAYQIDAVLSGAAEDQEIADAVRIGERMAPLLSLSRARSADPAGGARG